MSTSQNLTFSGEPTTYNFTTWNNPSLCTLSTCPKDYATLQYVPSLGGNAFFLAWFAILLIVQSTIGIKKRTWTFFTAMIGGCILEIIGYAARIMMHENIFVFDHFLMYLVTLTIAPCFFAAAIYLTFTRLIILHGAHPARLKPRTYTIIFITWDIVSLVLQAAGGALADTAGDEASGQTGIDIMIAGLASQVASLAIFMILVADFVWRARRDGNRVQERVERMAWVGLVGGLAAATLTIFIRSCYRVAELRGGFSGKLANDEVAFMILEGGMVAIAALALTVAHPGFVFGRVWKLKNVAEVFSSSVVVGNETPEKVGV